MMSKKCICCGRDIPDILGKFICGFCEFEQLRAEEEIHKRIRYAYEDGYNAGVARARINIEALKEHIRSLTGMFTDEGFMVDMKAVLNAIDFMANDGNVEAEE
jgi:hypothetical protein